MIFIQVFIYNMSRYVPLPPFTPTKQQYMPKESTNPFGQPSEAMSRLHGTVRKAFTGYYRVKDFIRRVRACKTASDERALVAKESAAIRDSFKGGPAVGREHRYHSLAKLVYIYLLGYPSIFGQVECMKLAASTPGNKEISARLKDKRLGYLGVTLLSDEHQETLTLVTNSLKFDLNSDSEPVQSLALNILSLLASTGMARELACEVELLLTSPSPNIRKKAMACATKLVQKDPELIEIFEPRLTSLLSDKNHSVQLAAVNFFQTLIQSTEQNLSVTHYKLLPSLLRILQSLQTAPLDTEFDVSGVSDPVLQVALLKTIRQLARTTVDLAVLPDSASFVDALNDLLAQLATTLDTSKNVGNAVLYEVVLTVMSLPFVDQSLVNLAIVTLGRFLSGNSCGDNNLRYVALNLLTKILTSNNLNKGNLLLQIQKHQSTILACLHDADTSIRKKAADLSLLLVKNVSDLSEIAPALLDLCCRDADYKYEVSDKLARVILKHARDPIIFLNLYIRVLKQVDSRHPGKNEIVTEFIGRASSIDSVLVVRELYFALTILDDNGNNLKNDDPGNLESSFYSSSSMVEKPKINRPSDALLEAAFWFFGEFGQIVPLESLCTPVDLIDLISAFIEIPGDATASFALNALAKLSTRLPDHLETIQTALEDAKRNLSRSRRFALFDRARELARIVKNPQARAVAFESIEYKNPCVYDSVSEASEINESASQSSISDTSLTPALVLNHVSVYIDQSQVTSPSSLQLQLLFKSTSPLCNVNIALAVSPRDFDFDYLAPASSSTIDPTDPLSNYISLSIILKKLARTKSDSIDLLDLSDPGIKTEQATVHNWNKECFLKIKVNYQLTSDPEAKPLQQIGQLPNILIE